VRILISGAVGVILTGIFAQKSIASSDGFTVIDGGMIDKNWKQMYKQLAWVGAGGTWSFVITYLMSVTCYIKNKTKFFFTDPFETLA
jgi:Amt family ammonium transporter